MLLSVLFIMCRPQVLTSYSMGVERERRKERERERVRSQDGIASSSTSCTFCRVAMQEGADLSSPPTSASSVGQDQPPDGSVLERLSRLERVAEQILAISVPQIMKDPAIMPQHAPAERV